MTFNDICRHQLHHVRDLWFSQTFWQTEQCHNRCWNNFKWPIQLIHYIYPSECFVTKTPLLFVPSSTRITVFWTKQCPRHSIDVVLEGVKTSPILFFYPTKKTFSFFFFPCSLKSWYIFANFMHIGHTIGLKHENRLTESFLLLNQFYEKINVSKAWLGWFSSMHGLLASGRYVLANRGQIKVRGNKSTKRQQLCMGGINLGYLALIEL